MEDYEYHQHDQLLMHRALVDATERAAVLVDPPLTVVPVGTAIQNGRTSSLCDSFCRDGFHLSPGLGRFTAACVMYGTIVGQDVRNNRYIPPQLTPQQTELAKTAAYHAVINPRTVTPAETPNANTF